METIVVTGIRASLKKSLDEKRCRVAHRSHHCRGHRQDAGQERRRSLSRVVGVTISRPARMKAASTKRSRQHARHQSELTQTLINGHSVSRATGSR
jgi:hypothetical protein